jgi:hypothetical protein
MTLPHLPLETWYQILDECISVPTFLDPNHLFEVLNPMHYTIPTDEIEAKYWAAERQRNVLRRVCKGWNAYFTPFEHRFVRTKDVYHGRVPKKALYTAIRIYFDRCSPFTCKRCQNLDKNDIYDQLFADANQLPTKIVDGMADCIQDIAITIIRSHAKMPHLSVILQAGFLWDKYQNWANTPYPNSHMSAL